MKLPLDADLQVRFAFPPLMDKVRIGGRDHRSVPGGNFTPEQLRTGQGVRRPKEFL